MAVQISGNDITVPRDTTVTRNLTVGGVLTYEDVTNVDSVGLITARSGIKVTSGDIAMDTAGNITLGDSGSSSDDRIVLGAGSDLSIYHDGSNSRIHSPSHSLFIRTGSVAGFFNGDGTEDILKGTVNGAVELYYDNSKKLETTTNGIAVTGQMYGNSAEIRGDAGSDATLNLFSDAGSQAADKVRIRQTHVGNSFLVESFANGSSYQSILKGTDSRTIELHYQGTKMLETISTGTSIPDGKFAKFGDSNDMAMGHNTYNYITYTGNEFRLTGDSSNGIRLMPKSDETAALFVPNGAVELYHDGTKQCETSANGLAFPNGKAIDFSAQTIESTSNYNRTVTAEKIDYYEEGYLDPTAISAGLTWDTSNNRQLRYVRIGNWVSVSGLLLVSSRTSNSNTIKVAMPFTSASQTSEGYYTRGVGAVMYQYVTLSANMDDIVAYVGGNENYMRFFQTRKDGGGWTELVNSNLGGNNSTQLYFSVNYMVA